MLIVNTQGFTRKILDNPKYHVGPVYEIDLAFPYRYFDRVQDNGNYKQGSKQGEGNDRNNSTGSTTLAPGQYLRGTGFKTWNLGELVVWLTNSSAESLDGYNDPHSALPNISLTSQDVKRWEMAWRTIQIYERDHTFLNLRLIFQRCKDWPEMGDILEELPIALGFGAAALIYGGLHALAWFAHFDSTTEQLLWRISACVVMGGVPVICVLNYLDGKVWINNHTDIVFKIKNVLSRALGILMGLAILAYVLARGYLVVECFINLSHLPAEVYDVPTWSTYFPHIS